MGYHLVEYFQANIDSIEGSAATSTSEEQWAPDLFVNPERKDLYLLRSTKGCGPPPLYVHGLSWCVLLYLLKAHGIPAKDVLR